MRIRRIVPTTLNGGQTVFAATTDTIGANTGGIYRSDDGGVTWSTTNRLSGANGLPDAGVSDLIADPGSPNRFYAAVVGPIGAGIYRLDVTGGNTNWQPVSNNLPVPALAGGRIELSATAAGVNPVYAGVVNNQGFMQGVYRGVTGAGGVITWTAVGPVGQPPSIYGNYNPMTGGGAQGLTHFSIVADPAKDNLVYVGGDAGDNLARGDSTLNTWTALVPLTGTAAQPGTVVPDAGAFPATTAPHVDSRHMAFSGQDILQVCDGGIYRCTKPQADGAAPAWSSVNGNLQNTEFYQVALDTLNNGNPADDVVLGAAQDNSAEERDAGGTWQQKVGGDGTLVLADSTNNIHYLAVQNFDLGRDAGGVGTTPAARIIGGAGTLTINPFRTGKPFFDTLIETLPFVPAAALNGSNPKRMLVGGNQTLYESTDSADNFRSVGGLDDPTKTKALTVPNVTGTVTAIAYGNLVNPNLAYVGTSDGNIAVTTDITPLGGGFTLTDFKKVAKMAMAGGRVLGIVVDPNNAQIAYAVTDQGVFRTIDGAHWTSLTANLLDVIPFLGVNTLASIALFNNNTVTTDDDVLLVGGLGGVYRMLTPPVGGCPDAAWTKYGQGLPNALVTSLVYDPQGNTLLAGTLGRGAWRITDVSATIATPAVLEIDGDASPNNISIRPDPANPTLFLADDGQGSQRFQLANFSQVQIRGMGGADNILIDSAGSPGNNLRYLPFLVTVDGGGQPGDSLTVDDSNDMVGRTVTITPTTIGADPGDNLLDSCGRLSYGGVTSLTLKTGPGGDVIRLQGTSATTHVSAGDGDDTLSALNAATNDWMINAPGGGTISGGLDVAFSGVENLSGGTAADTFTFLTSGSISGNLDGGGGGDTLDYHNLAGPITVNLQTQKAPAIGGTFSNISSLVGSGGSDTLVGPDGGAAWNLTDPNAGSVSGVNFSSFENLTGGADNDTFTFINPGKLDGSIDGGGGDNTITGDNTGDTFNITDLNQGTIDTLLPNGFSNIQNLSGGPGPDTFAFQGSGHLSGKIDGGAGSDRLDFSATGSQVVTLTTLGGTDGFSGNTGVGGPIGGTFANINALTGSTDHMDRLHGLNRVSAWSISGGNSGQYQDTVSSRMLAFTDIEFLDGGTHADAFTFTGGTLAGNIDGGAGAPNTIVGDNGGRAFTVTDVDTGTIPALLFGTFTRVQNLTGGTGADTFAFQAAGRLSGTVDGGAGKDRLDFSGAASQSVALTGLGGADGFTGVTPGGVIGGTFANINAVTGSAAGTTDNLFGLNRVSAWNVTGVDAGQYRDAGSGQALDFASVDFLTGGAASDTFTILAGARVTGRINGGGGPSDVLRALGGAFGDRVGLLPGRLTLDDRDTLFSNIEAVRLLGQGGNDVFGISAALGNPVPPQGILVDGGAGSDLLVVAGSGAADGVALTPAALLLNGSPIGYARLEQMDIHGGNGADVFNALSVNYQAALGLVRFFGELGNDTIGLTPSATTQFYIDGGPPVRPTFPGDSLFLVFQGAVIQPPVLLTNGGSDGIYNFTNRRRVQFVSIENGAGGLLDIQPWP
jgi:hypothetical protein